MIAPSQLFYSHLILFKTYKYSKTTNWVAQSCPESQPDDHQSDNNLCNFINSTQPQATETSPIMANHSCAPCLGVI